MGPPTLTLSIAAGGSPQPGKFFEDIGFFAIRGVISTKLPGKTVETYWWKAASKQWVRSASVTTAAGGAYAVNQRVGGFGRFTFRTTLGGVPGARGVTWSNAVTVAVANSYVVTNRPAPAVDALKNPAITGSVFPARPGVRVNIDVLRTGRYLAFTAATTDAAGRFRASLAYGNARLVAFRVRTAYRAVNRPRWEVSGSSVIRRVKVLNAVITRTTANEVAKTYRRGCPVGPSKLRTITMNFYGFDRLMHRGVLIIRTNLTGRTTRGFLRALAAQYPIAKMRNPNNYGGNDPRQMAADNTSGFNCRKVVGDPFTQSPHSYGIAMDVNTVQNPYRDRNGKWWPSNGRAYIHRTPRRAGMLTYNSSLTKQLRKEGFFWGGLWSPGRDYQHFEYDR